MLFTPVLIHFLGKNEYGLYNSVVSTISMLYLLGFGFNNGYIRFFSGFKRDNDLLSISKLNGLMMVVFIIIGLVALIIGLYISNNLRLVFKDGLTPDELRIARKMMLILSFYLLFYFPSIVFTQIISAHEKFIFLKTVQIIRTVATPIITIPFLYFGFRSVMIVLISSAVYIFIDFSLLFYVIFHLKEIFVFRNLEKDLFIKMAVYTSFIAINIIIDQINWKLDIIILGRYCGSGVVAIYTIGSIFHTCFQRFSTSISNIFTPRIHRLVASKSIKTDDELNNLFIRVGRIQFFVLAFILTAYIFFGKPFIKLWAGNDFSQAYFVGLILMFSVLSPLIQNIGIEIQRAKNVHKYVCIIYFFIAICNTILTIVLCPHYGAIGAAVGTAFSMIFGECIVMNIFYYKVCNINILLFWKNILRITAGLVLPCFLGAAIMKFVSIESFLHLFLYSIPYLLFYIGSMWLFGLNQDEKKLFSSHLNTLYDKVFHRMHRTA